MGCDCLYQYDINATYMYYLQITIVVIGSALMDMIETGFIKKAYNPGGLTLLLGHKICIFVWVV